jgi:hypothetical protein
MTSLIPDTVQTADDNFRCHVVKEFESSFFQLEQQNHHSTIAAELTTEFISDPVAIEDKSQSLESAFKLPTDGDMELLAQVLTSLPDDIVCSSPSYQNRPTCDANAYPDERQAVSLPQNLGLQCGAIFSDAMPGDCLLTPTQSTPVDPENNALMMSQNFMTSRGSVQVPNWRQIMYVSSVMRTTSRRRRKRMLSNAMFKLNNCFNKL